MHKLSVSSSANKLILGQVTNLHQISELVHRAPNLYHRSEIFVLSYGSRQNRLLKILEFMVRVTEKGLVANSWNKRNIFFSLSEWQNLGRIEHPVKVIFSTLRGSYIL